MDEYVLKLINKSKDPLSKTMTRYLDTEDLLNLSQANKSFQSIAKPSLRLEKARAYRLAQNEMDKWMIDDSYRSKYNASQGIRLWEFVYMDDPSMLRISKIMRKLYRQRYNEPIMD
jgi:hypothetical protein